MNIFKGNKTHKTHDDFRVFARRKIILYILRSDFFIFLTFAISFIKFLEKYTVQP